MTEREYLDTEATAELTGLAVSTLEKLRLRGDGIPFTKAGRSVRYAVTDIRAWMAARRVGSTSEAGVRRLTTAV